MASRPRAGRGTAGRDSSKDVDVEADLLARVLEGIKKARDQHDRQRELGMEIMVLEEEMKSEGKCCIVHFAIKALVSCPSLKLSQNHVLHPVFSVLGI